MLDRQRLNNEWVAYNAQRLTQHYDAYCCFKQLAFASVIIETRGENTKIRGNCRMCGLFHDTLCYCDTVLCHELTSNRVTGGNFILST